MLTFGGTFTAEQAWIGEDNVVDVYIVRGVHCYLIKTNMNHLNTLLIFVVPHIWLVIHLLDLHAVIGLT